MQYEDLYRDLPIDAVALIDRIDAHRVLYNEIRPHEGIAMNSPHRAYTDHDHHSANAPT